MFCHISNCSERTDKLNENFSFLLKLQKSLARRWRHKLVATQDVSRKSTASPLTPILYAQCDALSEPICLFFHNLPLSKDIKDRSVNQQNMVLYPKAQNCVAAQQSLESTLQNQGQQLTKTVQQHSILLFNKECEMSHRTKSVKPSICHQSVLKSATQRNRGAITSTTTC